MAMAYVALPTRDSAFLLLANAAPRLPRTATASCSVVDAAPVRALKVQVSSLFGANPSSSFKPRGRRMFASLEGSVAVEEPAVSEEPEERPAPEEAAAVAEVAESSAAPAKKFQRSDTLQRRAKRVIRVPKEQLVPGAVFTGTVCAVQSYGAFVDIGAFTDGLVHISQLTSGFVKEVTDVAALGQEVSVTVVEVNEQAGRITLTMRDKESEAAEQASRSGSDSGAAAGVQGESSGKPMNRGKIAGRGSGSARASSSSRTNDDRKASKLKKGQELKGTVKNIIRNGAFIEFAEEGEEGFLRGSEITEGGENVAVDTLLTVGQEVTVRVLKFERGKAALTMKPQVDMSSINDSLNTNVGAGGASNPFATFFRSANLVPAAPASVDAQKEVKTPAAAPAAAVETPAVEEASETEETPAPSVDAQEAVETSAAVVETPAVEEASETEETPAPSVDAEEAVKTPAAAVETPAVEEASKTEESPAPVNEPKPGVEEPSATKAAQPDEPAAKETPVTKAAQPDEPAAKETKSEEPHSLSLGEIAEGIGSAVGKVEKVVEAAADTIRDKLPE